MCIYTFPGYLLIMMNVHWYFSRIFIDNNDCYLVLRIPWCVHKSHKVSFLDQRKQQLTWANNATSTNPILVFQSWIGVMPTNYCCRLVWLKSELVSINLFCRCFTDLRLCSFSKFSKIWRKDHRAWALSWCQKTYSWNVWHIIYLLWDRIFFRRNV